MCKMIKEKIRYLRNQMHNMIKEKENLLDPEVIRLSQELDILIDECNKNIDNSRDFKKYKGVAD